VDEQNKKWLEELSQLLAESTDSKEQQEIRQTQLEILRPENLGHIRFRKHNNERPQKR
jgi:hypothetical protein